jgi:hypothetical protein
LAQLLPLPMSEISAKPVLAILGQAALAGWNR